MKKLFNCILLLVCAFTITTTAQETKTQLPSFTLKSAPNDPIPDSIEVVFYKGIISGLHKENVKIRKNLDRSFSFSFSKQQAILPFALFVYYGKNGRIQIITTQIFYAESSDQIEIIVTKGSPIDNIIISGDLAFSGIGAEKYKVAIQLERMKKDFSALEMSKAYKIFGGEATPSTGKIESKNYHNTSEFLSYFNVLFENTRIDMQRRQDTLSKYERQLDTAIRSSYSQEFITYIDFLNIVHWLFRRAPSKETKQAIADFYFSKIDSLRKPVPDNLGFNLGMQYTWRKGMEIMFETDYKTKGNGFPLQVQYEDIKAIKNIELRDILITRFFENPAYYHRYINNSEARDSCLTDALKFVKEPELRDALNHQLLFVKGAKMPNFSFPDSTGSSVTLKDLKGKVCILDFYFEGCGSCASFAKRFETEVYPSIMNDPNFKLLSVNTDLTRKGWMRAIKSGKYTQSTSVNLSTGPSGYNHPLLRHYKITAFPWILLIDKNSKVISFNIYSSSSQEIIRMIKTALSEQVSK